MNKVYFYWCIKLWICFKKLLIQNEKKLYSPSCFSFLGKIENEVSSVVKNQRGVPQYEKVGEFSYLDSHLFM